MNPPLVILALTLATLSLTACASETKVISNNSVSQKFAAFNKQGWSVTGGDIPRPERSRVASAQNPQTPNLPANNPFSNPVWKTNFRVDDPNLPKPAAPAHTPSPAPTSIGDFVLPSAPGAVVDPPAPSAPPASHNPAPSN